MLKINSKELAKGLKKVKTVASGNVVLPVLAYCKITPTEIACTNLQVSIKEKVNFSGEGDYLLPVNELSNICNVSNGELMLESEKVTCGRDKYTLGEPYDIGKFPAIEDEIEGTKLSVDDTFLSYLVNASRCVTADINMPTSNVNLVYKGERLYVYGADTFRMFSGVFECKEQGKDFNVFIPTAIIKSLAGLYGDFTLIVNEKKIFLSNGQTTVIGMLSEEKAPLFEQLLRPREEQSLLISRELLVDALNKITGIYNTLPLCMISFLDPNIISFTISDNETKKDAETQVEFKHEITIPKIGINSRHLLDLLSLMPSECKVVNLGIRAHNQPIIITSQGIDTTLMLMPLAI